MSQSRHPLSTRPLADTQECADGTTFGVFSELVRGEPRFYWVMRRGPDEQSFRRVREAVLGDFGGSHDRRVAQRAARRAADEHDRKRT